MALGVHRDQMHNCNVDSSVLLCGIRAWSLSGAAVVHALPSALWHSALQLSDQELLVTLFLLHPDKYGLKEGLKN